MIGVPLLALALAGCTGSAAGDRDRTGDAASAFEPNAPDLGPAILSLGVTVQVPSSRSASQDAAEFDAQLAALEDALTVETVVQGNENEIWLGTVERGTPPLTYADVGDVVAGHARSPVLGGADADLEVV